MQIVADPVRQAAQSVLYRRAQCQKLQLKLRKQEKHRDERDRQHTHPLDKCLLLQLWGKNYIQGWEKQTFSKLMDYNYFQIVVFYYLLSN